VALWPRDGRRSLLYVRVRISSAALFRRDVSSHSRGSFRLLIVVSHTRVSSSNVRASATVTCLALRHALTRGRFSMKTGSGLRLLRLRLHSTS